MIKIDPHLLEAIGERMNGETYADYFESGNNDIILELDDALEYGAIHKISNECDIVNAISANLGANLPKGFSYTICTEDGVQFWPLAKAIGRGVTSRSSKPS